MNEIYKPNDHEVKKVFITGGTEGIGKAIAENFLYSDHQVAMCARSLDRINDAKEAGYIAEVFDLVDTTSLPDFSRRIVNELGGIDFLVLNAGVSGVPMREESVEERVQREKETHNINYEAPIAIAQSLVDELRKSKGVLAFLTSRFAKVKNPPESARPYAESKRNLERFFSEFAADPLNKDVLVIGIDPGAVDTNLRQRIIDSNVAPELSHLARAEKEKGLVNDPNLVGRAIVKILQLRADLDPTSREYKNHISSGSIISISDTHLELERNS